MIERKWEGGTAVLIASGPSLTQEDVDYCRGKAHVLVVNDGYRIAPWADALYGCDPGWWDYHFDKLTGFQGEKWTSSIQAREKYGLKWVAGDHKPGLSLSPDLIHYGSNSGYQALNLAVLFGAKTIYLLGYDMQKTGGKSHWHGNHPPKLNKSTDYRMFISRFQSVEPSSLKEAGVTVVNCSRETALYCFPRAVITEVL